jgi:transcriptional regulator of acetoin/glycerol metabolism
VPKPAQAAFLRALQERKVLPVGATRPISVDLAATHRPIQTLVDDGIFRTDPAMCVTRNVRELETALATAAALTTDGIVALSDLPESLRAGSSSTRWIRRGRTLQKKLKRCGLT